MCCSVFGKWAENTNRHEHNPIISINWMRHQSRAHHWLSLSVKPPDLIDSNWNEWRNTIRPYCCECRDCATKTNIHRFGSQYISVSKGLHSLSQSRECGKECCKECVKKMRKFFRVFNKILFNSLNWMLQNENADSSETKFSFYVQTETRPCHTLCLTLVDDGEISCFDSRA